jgi:hypothetical protein
MIYFMRKTEEGYIRCTKILKYGVIAETVLFIEIFLLGFFKQLNNSDFFGNLMLATLGIWVLINIVCCIVHFIQSKKSPKSEEKILDRKIHKNGLKIEMKEEGPIARNQVMPEKEKTMNNIRKKKKTKLNGRRVFVSVFGSSQKNLNIKVSSKRLLGKMGKARERWNLLRQKRGMIVGNRSKKKIFRKSNSKVNKVKRDDDDWEEL